MEFFHLKFDYFDRPHLPWKSEMGRAISQRYLVLIEAGPGLLNGFVPDVPGVAAIGRSLVELRERLYDALELRLGEAALKGKTLPMPTMGFDDLSPGTKAEWMTVRTRVGGELHPRAMVRPCPAR